MRCVCSAGAVVVTLSQSLSLSHSLTLSLGLARRNVIHIIILTSHSSRQRKTSSRRLPFTYPFAVSPLHRRLHRSNEWPTCCPHAKATPCTSSPVTLSCLHRIFLYVGYAFIALYYRHVNCIRFLDVLGVGWLLFPRSVEMWRERMAARRVHCDSGDPTDKTSHMSSIRTFAKALNI